MFKEEINDFEKMIDDLQDLWLEFKLEDRGYFLSYSTSYSTYGILHSVSLSTPFGELTLWNSEDDERDWIEEEDRYENIRIFLIKKIHEVQEGLRSVDYCVRADLMSSSSDEEE